MKNTMLSANKIPVMKGYSLLQSRPQAFFAALLAEQKNQKLKMLSFLILHKKPYKTDLGHVKSASQWKKWMKHPNMS